VIQVGRISEHGLVVAAVRAGRAQPQPQVAVVVIRRSPFTIRSSGRISHEQRIGIDVACTGPAALNTTVIHLSSRQAIDLGISSATGRIGVGPEDAVAQARRNRQAGGERPSTSIGAIGRERAVDHRPGRRLSGAPGPTAV